MNRKNLQNFDEIKVRILHFAENQKIPMGVFFEKIAVSSSNFAGKGAESSLKSDNIVKVLNTFPEINPDWLLLGKGEMLRKPDNTTNENTLTATTNDNLQSLIDMLNRTLIEKDKQIDRLLTIIEKFK